MQDRFDPAVSAAKLTAIIRANLRLAQMPANADVTDVVATVDMKLWRRLHQHTPFLIRNLAEHLALGYQRLFSRHFPIRRNGRS